MKQDIPHNRADVLDGSNRFTRDWYDYFRRIKPVSAPTNVQQTVINNSQYLPPVSEGSSTAYANAQRRALQAIGVGAWTAVSFDTEGADSGSMFSLSNPTYIEIPSNGIYTISAFVPWRTATTVISNRGIAICKNAAPASGNLSGVWQAASGDSTAQSCTWTGTLAAGDKIYLYVFTGDGADDIRVNTGYGACFLGVMGFAT